MSNAAGHLTEGLKAFLLHDGLLGQADFVIGPLQLPGALLDSFFQAIIGLLQRLIALLDLREHLIEPIDELAQFVMRMPVRPQSVVLFRRNEFSGLCQIEYRFGDDALKR